jgi:hypothetical protein
VEVRTEAAVDAKYATVNDGAESEVVKDLAAPPPDVASAVLALALVVEPVDLCYLTRLVVAADKGHSFGVADLECEEEKERFDAVETTVHKVAWEA